MQSKTPYPLPQKNSWNMLRVYILAGTIFLHAVCLAQNPPFINYNEQNGLSTSVIYGLFQDSEDNIWFCTNAGVVRYNGNKLSSYEKKDGLADNEIFKIYEDSKHRLWFMASNGRLSYYHDKKIYNSHDHPVFSTLNSSSFISDIHEDESGRIWIIPAEGDLYRLSADLSTVESIPMSTHNGIFFNYRGANYLSAQEGIYSFAEKRIILDAQAYKEGRSVIRHCRNGQYVYSGRENRLCVYDLENKTAGFYNTPELPAILNSIVKIDTLLYICSNTGLSIYNSNHKPAGLYFSNANVSHILKDREGSIWVATLNKGVMYIPNIHIRLLNSADYFSGNKILKLNGLGRNVVIGQTNSRIDLYRGGAISRINSTNDSKGEGLTYSIKANAADSGFTVFSQSGITEFFLRSGMRNSSKLIMLDMAPCGKDSVYISTIGFLGKYGKALDKSGIFVANNKGIIDSIRAGVLYYDEQDSVLYAGTKQGMFMYKNRKRTDPGHHLFDDKYFTDIGKNRNGVFIAATRGDGLFFFNRNSVYTVNEKEGLSDSKCSSLFIQNDSTVWVTTNNGLNKIVYYYTDNRFRFRIKTYYKNDGLQSNYVNDVYIYGDSIWLAANNGLSVFHEKDLDGDPYPPKLSIDAFKVNNEVKAIEKDKTIELERNSHDIVIEFNCTTFKNTGSIRYKYKITGLDKNWIETRNNQVDITGLGPGTYEFEVFAYSVNENRESNVARVKFYIRRAFWETTWFRVLCVAALLLIILLIIRYQFKRVKNRFAIRQKFISYEKELLDLEQQALRLQMNPHFIFNALNSIQHCILTGRQDEAYHNLELFSSLIRGILENSKHKFISLEDEIDILKIYIEIEAARFDGNFKYELKIDPAIDISCIRIPPMLIQPFVENSIWHGLMPKTTGEKKLLLSFMGEGDEVVCIVEDNGIGRRNAAKAEGKKQGTSLGTAITLNRMANINLLENKKYTFSIFDKENDDGTIVTIRIQV